VHATQPGDASDDEKLPGAQRVHAVAPLIAL
jgi:hypothetical protein